jgi:hypothetical protein
VSFPPLEWSRHIDVLESITIPDWVPNAEDSVAQEPLEEMLSRLDPNLTTMLAGAREAVRSRNPDKCRHVAISLRELFTAVLHRVAPEEAVAAWTADPSHYHKGRPTRRARYLYVCRGVGVGSLSRYVEDDTKAALALVDALQGGTHGLQSDLDDRQLQVLILRVESMLVYLLSLADVG